MITGPTQKHVQAFGRAVADYLRAHCSKLNGFQWPITEHCVITAVGRGLLGRASVVGGFAETMELRQGVAREARRIQAGVHLPQRIDDLAELARFVIEDWGNVKGNDAVTIREYAERFTGIAAPFDQIGSAADLQAQVAPRKLRGLFRFGGISSWSKWLNFVWNDWALIYDARIAFALDAIHFMREVDAPVLPVPMGRNGLLAHFDAQSTAAFAWLARYAGERPSREQMAAWMTQALAPEKDAYLYYLAVMGEAHRLLWPAHEVRPVVHTEMLLFLLSTEDIAEDFAREMLARLAASVPAAS